MKSFTINPKQCKAARTLLDWSQDDLSQKIRATKKTIADFERGATTPHPKTLLEIEEVLKENGIIFLNSEGEIGVKFIKTDKKQLKIAQNNLVVIKSFLLGSLFEELLLDKFNIKNLPYDWSDRMLDDLSSSKLDMIIYNTNRAKKFINDRYLDNIEILDHCCYSMGGENFFLLGKKDIWKETSLSEFKKNIQNNGVTTIVTTKNSDNIDNLSLLMDVNDPKLKIVNLPADNIRREIFDINPNILVCGSQNSRFNLLYQDDIIEVLNYSSINDKAKKNQIISNSENSFIVNKNIYQYIKKKDLLEIIKMAKNNFHELGQNKKRTRELVQSLLELVNHLTHSQDNAEFIVRNILYKTYRIGSPL